MKKLVVALFLGWLLAASCEARVRAQMPERDKAPAPPALTDVERQQIDALGEAVQQSVQEEIAIRNRALSLRPSDSASYESLGRAFAQVVLTQQILQQREQEWLKAVQQRTGCADCTYDRPTRQLVRPAKPPEKK